MSAFIGITDPLGAQWSDGRPHPITTWIEVDGAQVWGLDRVERRIGRPRAAQMLAAIRSVPQAGTFDRFTWRLGARSVGGAPSVEVLTL